MTAIATPAAHLLERVLELAPDRDPATALKLGSENWEAIRDRGADRHDAETCRLLALTAATAQQFGLAAVWRARALIRFSELGWMDGVAMILVGEALATLARHNDDYSAGRTLDVIRDTPAPAEILETIEVLALGDRKPESEDDRVSAWSPGPDLTARMYWEKRGFFALVARRLDDARSSYARAAQVARPGRGAAKVHAGAVLVEYLAARTGASPRVEMPSLVAEQESVLAELTAVGDPELRAAAAHNLAVIRRGGDDLLPYEIL